MMQTLPFAAAHKPCTELRVQTPVGPEGGMQRTLGCAGRCLSGARLDRLQQFAYMMRTSEGEADGTDTSPFLPTETTAVGIALA